MSKIIQNEFKVGDTIDKEEVRDTFKNFKIFGDTEDPSRLSDENFRNEGINESKVLDGVLSSFTRFYVNSGPATITATSDTERCLPTDGALASADTNTALIFEDIKEGDEIIVRFSAELFMRDYGARTFLPGVPTILGAAIYYREFDHGELPLPSDESLLTDKDAWKECAGTRQRFACAFSSKIPSASNFEPHIYDESAITTSARPAIAHNGLFADDGGDHYHLDTRVALFNDDGSRMDYDDASISDFLEQYTVLDTQNTLSDHMFFEYLFNYSAVWRYQASSSKDEVHFRLFGARHSPASGLVQGDTTHATRGNEKEGCLNVVDKDFTLTDISASGFLTPSRSGRIFL